MNFFRLVLFTAEMGSGFPLFSETRLEVIKTDTAVVGSSRKIYEMLPSIDLSLLYHNILPLLRLQIFLQVQT